MSFLFYTQNQVTDFFTSNNPSGDPFYGDTYLRSDGDAWNEYVLERYALLGTPSNSVNVHDIADETFNLAIRTTATLYNWFAEKTNHEIVTYNEQIVIEDPSLNLGYIRPGCQYFGNSFKIHNNTTEPITFKITKTNPNWKLKDDQIGSPEVDTLYVRVMPGWPRYVNYSGNVPIYAGYFTETIFIEANAIPSIYKTHTVIGEVGAPDFCFEETEANASSPEEILFNETFGKYFFDTDKIFTEDYSKLSLKEKMKFAYKMLDVAE